MKIDINSPVLNQITSDKSTKQVPASKLATTQSMTEDRTNFQSDSASIEALTSQAMQPSSARQAKVDALTQAVSDGSYRPDATETAAAILNSQAG